MNDPEFKIDSPIAPDDEQIEKIQNPVEYGLSINIPYQSIDFKT